MRLLSVLFVLILCACTSAKRSHEIHAVRMPVAPYLKMTCGELITEQKMVITELEAAGASVDKKYDSEKSFGVSRNVFGMTYVAEYSNGAHARVRTCQTFFIFIFSMKCIFLKLISVVAFEFYVLS